VHKTRKSSENIKPRNKNHLLKARSNARVIRSRYLPTEYPFDFARKYITAYFIVQFASFGSGRSADNGRLSDSYFIFCNYSYFFNRLVFWIRHGHRFPVGYNLLSPGTTVFKKLICFFFCNSEMNNIKYLKCSQNIFYNNIFSLIFKIFVNFFCNLYLKTI